MAVRAFMRRAPHPSRCRSGEHLGNDSLGETGIAEVVDRSATGLADSCRVEQRVEHEVGGDVGAELHEAAGLEVAARRAGHDEGDIRKRVVPVADLIGPHRGALVDELAGGGVDRRELVGEVFEISSVQ